MKNPDRSRKNKEKQAAPPELETVELDVRNTYYRTGSHTAGEDGQYTLCVRSDFKPPNQWQHEHDDGSFERVDLVDSGKMWSATPTPRSIGSIVVTVSGDKDAQYGLSAKTWTTSIFASSYV